MIYNFTKNPIKLEDIISTKKIISFRDDKNNLIKKNIYNEIKNKRLFYFIQPNLFKKENIFKFGVSGLTNPNSSLKRLIEYKKYYGINKKSNSCSGVFVYLIYTTEFNDLVSRINSKIFKIENKVKLYFNKKNINNEWIQGNPDLLTNKILNIINNKRIKDIQQYNRKSLRIQGGSILKNKLSYFVSNYDFQKLLDNPLIIKYSDLENYDFYELLPNKISYAIILLENELNKGHWVLLLKYKNILEYFDSYGERPFAHFEKIENRLLLGIEYSDMINFIKSVPKNYDVIYNDFKFQKYEENINTCGRWVYYRVFILLKYELDIDKFVDYIKILSEETKIYNLDKLILKLTHF